MRRISSVVLFGFVAACEPSPSPNVIPTAVVWMDWPAEVAAGTVFSVRLVVYRPCAVIEAFNPAPRADESAVTFAPYFLGEGAFCVLAQSVETLVDPNNLDTTGVAPGLAADFARTYEMRATTGVYQTRVVRTFGDVAVYPQIPLPGAPIRNAAGHVRMQVDTLGCVRIWPAGLFGAEAMVLENPTDTIGLSRAFVRGYLHYPATPVCGQAQVFHLVSRN